MSKLSLLALIAAASLTACAEKKAAEPAKHAPDPSAAIASPGAGAPASPSARAGKLPQRPLRLPTDPAAPALADDDRPRPSREQLEARRAERKQEMLDKFDADGNGELDDAERQAMHQSRVVEMIDRMDGDGDGKLSQAELDASPRRARRGGPDFATLDVDHDGFITSDELAQARPPRPFRDRGPDDRGPELGGPPATGK